MLRSRSSLWSKHCRFQPQDFFSKAMASTTTTLPKPSKGRNQLSFPPLVAQFRPSGQEPTWPGQEYTRRTRLKTHLDPTHAVSSDFVDEMKELLGDNYAHFEEAMKPSVSHGVARGRPPAEKGHKPIQPSYKLPRAATETLTETDSNPFASTTRSLSGHLSKSKVPEDMYTPWGAVPEYLFEDREKMPDLASWFEKYGRPKEGSINMGPYSTSHLAASLPPPRTLKRLDATVGAFFFRAHARLNLSLVCHMFHTSPSRNAVGPSRPAFAARRPVYHLQAAEPPLLRRAVATAEDD